MLIVRDEQMEVFERRLFEVVQRRVEKAIAATFPEIGEERSGAPQSGDADAPKRVRTVVERGIENAVGVDLGEAPDFAAFIALGLALRLTPPGPSGDWIEPWLMRPDVPGQTRLRMIESRLRRLGKDDPALAAIAHRVASARELTAP